MTRDRYTHPLTTPLRAFVDTVLPNLGGTVALAGQPFPAAFEGSGIRPRDARRNLFLGTTITRPGTDECLIGFAYDDQKSGQTDEDLYRADRAKLTLRYFPGG